MKRTVTLALTMILVSAPAFAGDQTTDAALGGAIGGATGAVIGSRTGGRDGAILGGAIGAAAGTAIATDGSDDGGHAHVDHYERREHEHYEGGDHRRGRFCPPGLAKQGRC